MSITDNIIKDSMEMVKGLYDQSTEPLYYHNWGHTMQVHDAALLIAENTENINNEDIEVLRIAAIFHDVAQTFGSENHEEEGAKMAEKFLKSRKYPLDKIERVKQIVLATQLNYKPKNIYDEIIKDADLSHLKDEQYLKTSYSALLKELNFKGVSKMTSKEWAKSSIDFLHNHKYYTSYAQVNFEQGKLKNIKKLEEYLKGEDESLLDDFSEPCKGIDEFQAEKKNKKKKKKNKDENPMKGVETMFKVSLRNHLSLSQIADNKANTLISVNGIIVSIVLSALFPKMDTHTYLVFPGLALLLFSILTIVLSILSTIPKNTQGKISRQEVLERKGNLIFFGNFHNMSLNDYEWGIGELMNDRDYLYKSLTRDLYFLGKVLHRKYTLLRYSYYVFVFGLITSILLFVASMRGVV